MLGSDKHKQAGQGILIGSLNWLASVLAFIIAMLLSPKLYSWSVDWIVAYVTDAYGQAWSGIVAVLWGLATFLIIFFASRATLGTLLILGGLAIITRFMM